MQATTRCCSAQRSSADKSAPTSRVNLGPASRSEVNFFEIDRTELSMEHKPNLPPIYRECRRLLLETEQSVLHFSRYHKYGVGADMRQQAMNIMRRVHRACFDKLRQLEHLQAMVWQVDDFKISLQLAMDVGAFATSNKGQPRFDAFERLARLASAVGKQCGGWYQTSQSQANRGPNAAPGSKPSARPSAHPSSLSACATSGGFAA
jgi:hypothetical protein